MNACEFLVRFGRLGDFGRFRAEPALPCERGQRVVVRTYRGLEIGEVLRPATEGHAHFLPNTTVGALVRHATAEDEVRDSELSVRCQALLTRCSALAVALALPLEFLDVEILLDGKRAVLHHLTLGSADPRELVSTLAREFDLLVELVDLTAPRPEPVEEEHGCGSCGSSEGGCGSCGSGGGCGSCDSRSTREHFAALREAMERQRTSLL
jgi:cell fate regulator YaaT (PSP1 superfamily)